MRAFPRILIAGLISAILAGPALAEAAPSCAILGQMAVSSWLEMLRLLGSQEPATLESVIARLADLTDTYTAIGCDVDALSATMDCLITRSGERNPASLARTCMAENGLTIAE